MSRKKSLKSARLPRTPQKPTKSSERCEASSNAGSDAVGAGHVWASPPVAQQPSMQLVRWRIFELGVERCLYGAVYGKHYGRRSSWIRQFDPVTMRVQTESGRLYELIGPPGFDDNAQYLLELDLASGAVMVDVTHAACAEYGVATSLLEARTQ